MSGGKNQPMQIQENNYYEFNEGGFIIRGLNPSKTSKGL